MDLSKKRSVKDNRDIVPSKPLGKGKIGKLIQRDEREMKAATFKIVRTKIRKLHNLYPNTFKKDLEEFIISRAEDLIKWEPSENDRFGVMKDHWIKEMSTVLEILSLVQLPLEEKQKFIDLFKKL